MKTNILIVYSSMIVGGSTTSLLSLLDLIDYDQYNIDLQLYSNDGALQGEINQKVSILPPLIKSRAVIKKIVNPLFYFDIFRGRIYSKKNGSKLINAQFSAKYEALACMTCQKEYDIAIRQQCCDC